MAYDPTGRTRTCDAEGGSSTIGHELSLSQAFSPQEVQVLVERARVGDEEAWEALFRRSYPKLFAYATRRLPTREQASDAVGEAVTRAVASIDRLRNDGAGFDAWMYGILRHVVVDVHRAASREGPGIVPDEPDGAPAPEDRALDREDAAHMRAAFERLTDSDQELLELRVVAGLSAEEVAEVLGRRPGAIRMAQHRALGRLRALLDKEADGRASA